MTNQELFIESLSDAINAAVMQLGGVKKVGTMLWPEKSAREAGSQLLNCLNPDHAQKLSLEQIDFLIDTARKHNCHDIHKYVCDHYGYEFKVITKESIKLDIQQQINVGLADLKGLLDRLEKLR